MIYERTSDLYDKNEEIISFNSSRFVTFTKNITDNDIHDVWNVTVDTTALVWDVTFTTAGTRTITWNPETQEYTTSTNSGQNATITNGATKNIAVTNKSNES